MAVAFDAGNDLVAQLVAGHGGLADLVGAEVLDLGGDGLNIDGEVVAGHRVQRVGQPGRAIVRQGRHDPLNFVHATGDATCQEEGDAQTEQDGEPGQPEHKHSGLIAGRFTRRDDGCSSGFLELQQVINGRIDSRDVVQVFGAEEHRRGGIVLLGCRKTEDLGAQWSPILVRLAQRRELGLACRQVQELVELRSVLSESSIGRCNRRLRLGIVRVAAYQHRLAELALGRKDGNLGVTRHVDGGEIHVGHLPASSIGIVEFEQAKSGDDNQQGQHGPKTRKQLGANPERHVRLPFRSCRPTAV